MKFKLRSSLFLSGVILSLVFLASCASFSSGDNQEEEAPAPVEDKYASSRNPYAPVALQQESLSQETANLPLPIETKSESKKPSLRFEEVAEATEPQIPPSSVPVETQALPTRSLWIWPTENQIIRQFDASNAEARGLDFSGKVGDSVRAVRSGKVVFSGAGLKGYGQLIIIKHDNNVLTAYAHNHNLLVKEGDLVDGGQVISEMGLNEQTGTPMLHFEVRLNGKPVDPIGYLPSRAQS